MVIVSSLTIAQEQSAGLVSYKCVSTSTAKAELNAVAAESKEVVHLANLLKETNIVVKQSLQLLVNDQACFVPSKNSMNHGKTKQFALKVHFIRRNLI